MKKLLRFITPAFAMLAFSSLAAQWQQYPVVTAPGLSDTFLIGTTTTNQQLSAGNLRTWILSADTTSIQASGSATAGQALVVTGTDGQGRITVTGTNWPSGGSPNSVTNSSGGAMTSGVLTKGTGANGIIPATPGTDYLTPNGNGSGLTALNGSAVASGTISYARLGTGGDGSGAHFFADDNTYKAITGGGDMLKSENLSGLANNTTARANLGANSAANLTTGIMDAARLPPLGTVINAITNAIAGSNITVTVTVAADGWKSVTIQGITTSQFLTLALSLGMMTNGGGQLWTNTSFVANGLIYSGANKQMLSVNVGSGAVTNDGAGHWGAAALRDSASLANNSFAFADSAGHIISGYDGASLSNLIGGTVISGDGTITVTPTRITSGGNAGSTNYALHATGGGGGALGYTNYYARTTNAFVFDASINQTAAIGLLTNSTLVFSNVNYLTNVSAQAFQIPIHQDTNGMRSIAAILVSGGLLRTNGAFTFTTNANATDILIARIDGTRTNVVLSYLTNCSSYVDTNSLASGGGGGCGVVIAAGNKTNETFNAGSLPGGWAAFGSTLAYGQTLPTTPTIPCQLSVNGLHATWSGSGQPYVQSDLGAFDCSAHFYERFYFYVNASGMNPSGGNYFEIAGADESIGVENCFRLNCEQLADSTHMQIWGAFSGAGTTTTYAITVGNWYRAETEYTANGDCALKIFDATNTQIGTTWTGTANNRCFRSIAFGIPDHNNSAGADVYITGVGLSTTGFLGQ